MANLVDTSQIASDTLLNSKLAVCETEIQSLTADKLLIEQDLYEANEALEKLRKELQLNIANMVTLQQDNDKMKQLIQTLSGEVETYKGQLIPQEDLQSKLKQLTEEKEKYGADFTQFKKDSAKDLGKLKNIHQEKIETLMKNHADEVHNLQNQVVELKGERTLLLDDHKDVVTAQATRLRAYEHQINLLETRNNRLQMNLEFSIKPKTTEIDTQGKIQKLEAEREHHLQQMQDLSNRMAMSRLNQHYDFRSKSLF
ncbi:MAG: hypothetical protein CMH46_00420 [Muricauda sp.]|nr:hypothetical protein [Allomuricauda sp.]MAU13987.1 hypothetical protein [Allomuricauda sp.]